MGNINTHPENSGNNTLPETEIKSSEPLLIGAEGKSYLIIAAKWAMFIAIVGFIMTAFMFLSGIGLTVVSSVVDEYQDFQSLENSPLSLLSLGITTIILCVIYFFPYYFLYIFSKKIKAGLLSDNQDDLNDGLKNLKKMFKFVGILLIISLASLVLAIPAMILSIGMIQALAGGVVV